ncbi:hypothetical protein BOW53_12840 [Solemya pervernicosa gill symbiont]|uniref:Sulphotransferase Stf0 domain-containing protein n=1 Tax=Solemya pervernicosa gill symbiont TaxID=642797 RepID=A0A1T2L231_9GAMM|nr:Stf0 family sulfotransferase [Solemya pervernicosa gill symbiont]OOZ39132.1 hypothetical protein BOW53_12840 [Solemya pervernicosa gill symbiont]
MSDGQSLFDKLVSSALDFERATHPNFRYVILSSPRCGSSLLAGMLTSTQQAGCPKEYLNRDYIRAYLKQSGLSDTPLPAYMQEMERRRTSPNGLFGVKLHWEHFVDIYGVKGGLKREGIDFIQSMDRVIRICRKDKISQAISYYIAIQTNRWVELPGQASNRESSSNDRIGFDPMRITSLLNALVVQEVSWQRFCRQHSIDPVDVCYETLVADYDAESRRVLGCLGLDKSMTIPQPPIKKQATELNAELRSRYLDYVGV